MIQLIYVSSAVNQMSEAELLELLEQARSRNQKQQITGMLLYADGNFFQVLEGERKDVEEIYEDIVKDKRNHGNIVIEKEEISERTFPNWSMGFKYLAAINKDEISGYTEFLEKEMTPEKIANKASDVVSLLYSFRKSI